MAMEARCATLAIRSERTSSIRKTPEMPVAHKPIVAELLKEASVGLVHPMASYLQAPGDPPRTTISAGRREHTSTIEMPVDTILLHTRSSKNEILIPCAIKFISVRALINSYFVSIRIFLSPNMDHPRRDSCGGSHLPSSCSISLRVACPTHFTPPCA